MKTVKILYTEGNGSFSEKEFELPDIKDNETRDEIVELIYQRNKFEYNSRLLKRITGYNPKTKYQDGIEKFLDWYLDYYN